MKAADVMTGDVVETKIDGTWVAVRVTGSVKLPKGGGSVETSWSLDRTVDGFYVEPVTGGRARSRKASELRTVRT